jgi:hypothetical protein
MTLEHGLLALILAQNALNAGLTLYVLLHARRPKPLHGPVK